jgi:aspartate/methionine/tyrosine aminotransferase
MIGSPSNPTGTTIPNDELAAPGRGARGAAYCWWTRSTTGSPTGISAASVALGDDVFVVNSFSKYQCMTGWRVGWMVAPAGYVNTIERMQAHFFICPPAPSQWAALSALEPESVAIYEHQREELERRRDYLMPALRSLGFGIPVEPDGAFYVYADVSAFTSDSWDWALALLRATGVAVTPGRDFGRTGAERFVRVSYTSSRAQLEEGVGAIEGFLRGTERA